MEIRHEPEEKRFVAEDGERLGVLDYDELDDGSWDYKHTFVPTEHRGGGVATRLVRFALDRARDDGRTVVPSCPFVATLIERYPEYRELDARRG